MEEHRRRMEERRELERRFYAGNIEFINRFLNPSISTEEFLEYVAAGEKEFVDICLARLDLARINLANINLTGAKLVGSNLSGANLTAANLSYAFLDGANLKGANLESANIYEVSVVGTNFENANLRGTLGFFGEALGSFYHNTIMRNGGICTQPYTE